MARPCLTKENTRSVFAASGSNATIDVVDDRVPVYGLDISFATNEIDRSDVYNPSGTGEPNIVTGRRTSFTITQEVFADASAHAALLAACPVERVDGDPEVLIYPSQSTCEDDGFSPCTIEVVEKGGNLYRATDCTGTFTMSGTPGERVTIVFEMTGVFELPIDAPPKYNNLQPISWGIPLIYRGSAVLYDGTPLANCPQFEFSPTQELAEIPSGCTPDGGGWTVPTTAGAGELTFTGVVSQKESIQKLWSQAVNGAGDKDLIFKVSDDAPFWIRMRNYTVGNPDLTSVNGFVGHTVQFSSSDWEIEWPQGAVEEPEP